MKRPHRKAHAISDMTEEERLELADTIEAEMKSIESKSIIGKHDGVMDDDLFEMLSKDIADENLMSCPQIVLGKFPCGFRTFTIGQYSS